MFRTTDVFCTVLALTEGVITDSVECSSPQVALDTQCAVRCKDGYQQSGPVMYTCRYLNGAPTWTPGHWSTCTGNDCHINWISLEDVI